MKNLEYYMKLNYSYVITPIVEDDGETYFELAIPDLPGFKIYEDSEEELFANLEDAKRAWFSANLSENRYIPEPKKNSSPSGRVTLRMSKSLHANLVQQADQEGVSLNSWINTLLEKNGRWESLQNILDEKFDYLKKELTPSATYNYNFLNVNQNNDKEFSIAPTDKVRIPNLVRESVQNV